MPRSHKYQLLIGNKICQVQITSKSTWQSVKQLWRASITERSEAKCLYRENIKGSLDYTDTSFFDVIWGERSLFQCHSVVLGAADILPGTFMRALLKCCDWGAQEYVRVGRAGGADRNTNAFSTVIDFSLFSLRVHFSAATKEGNVSWEQSWKWAEFMTAESGCSFFSFIQTNRKRDFFVLHDGGYYGIITLMQIH